jgi:serine/threonine-protein kinase
MIEPGQILDKYELLEKVGQGGMAVVYRGIDRQLKREVAVKVLHHHLAEHKEARNRFEREAQAVAKLRHENILEIFDYSGVDSDQSYIVTEFIDGQTLKELITERSLTYPEVGAMIAAQVCAALAHAHGLGVLHRDIKPENIMIRSDGVLKLTDFGIAQMLDTDRLTVTGQLLGSPAYMSPEHVEGKPLDVRTDVFSVGILLYQLTTNELPFRGRNPHEILKRIAECEFAEPNTLNPRVGKQLTRIIHHAMAREKDDRYRDVGAMLADLTEYLEGSGLTEVRQELGRFFAAPASYEIALSQRLVSTLATRGRDALADSKAQALEYFDRVLTIDPDNEEVLGIIDRMSRKQRSARVVALFAGVAVMGALGFAAQRMWRSGDDGATPMALAPSLDAGPVAAAGLDASVAPRADAAAAMATGPADAATTAEVAVVRVKKNGDDKPPPKARPDAGVVAPAGPMRTFTLRVFPKTNAEYRVGTDAWKPWTAGTVVEVGPGEHVVEVRNPSCCIQADEFITADMTSRWLAVTTPWMPAQITAICDKTGARAALLDDDYLPLGRARPVTIESINGERDVTITFLVGDGSIEKPITLKYGEQKKVTCDD